MIRTNETDRTDLFAISVPMVVTFLGVLGWVTTSWVSSQKQKY